MRALLWSLLLAGCARVDLEAGAPFLCAPDGGAANQCPGEWHCGLEGRCLRNTPGPWRCATSADCYGWHCGLEGACHAPEAGPWACSSNDDCFGWHCGVAGRCYERESVREVACRGDLDCAADAGWRCGPDARCVDTGAEALRLADLPVAPTVVDRTPPLWAGSATHVESGSLQVDGPCARLPVDIVTDAGLYRVTVPLGSQPCPGGATSRFVALPASVKSVATSSTATLLLLEDGGWASVEWPDAGVKQGAFPNGNLRSLRSGYDSIYGLGGGSVARWTPTGVEAVPVTGTVFDAVEYRDGRGQFQLAAVTDEGLRVGTVDGGLPVVAASCRSWVRVGLGSPGLEVIEANGNTFNVRTLVAPGTASATTPACMSTLVMPPFLERRAAAVRCETTTWSVEENAAFSWCKVAEGFNGDTINGRFELLRGVVASTTNRPGQRGLFASGWPVLRQVSPGGVTGPLLPVRAPRSIVTVGEEVRGFVLESAGQGAETGDSAHTVVLPVGGAWVDPVLPGLAPLAVTGRPGWVMAGLSLDGGVSSLFRWDPASFLKQPVWSVPGVATAAAGLEWHDGGALTLVASGDAVRFFDGNRSGVAFVPASQTTVTSMALAPDALGARYAGGYVVASGRVFRFRADNPVVWRSDELIVSDDEAVEVFFDGLRARVGMRNGGVVSLPARVTVAPPTAERVLDFEQHCQHTFALTEGGLQHLSVTAGNPVGQWSPVVSRAFGASPERGGLLHARSGGLLVFWFDGRVTELRSLPCTP